MRSVVSACLRFTGSSYLVSKRFGKKRVTVVNHHRIDDPGVDGFAGLRALVSATPEMFDRQVRYLKSEYNLIAGQDISAFIKGQQELPDNACLITFDDGYLDNYRHAAPILAKYNAPAIIFLATSRMSEPHAPLWWDEVAQLIQYSNESSAYLPLLGLTRIRTQTAKDAVSKRLTKEMKYHNADARRAYISELASVLGNPAVKEPERYFMNWDEVRSLVTQGLEFHAHTVNHPILSQVDAVEAEAELSESRASIQRETDQPSNLFAYPNGESDDYNATTLALLGRLGFDAAFTLQPGPLSQDEFKANPYEVRRVYLSYKDTWSKFVVKLDGVPRLIERF